MLWYCFEWGWTAGNYLGSSIGIVFAVPVVLERRILDRNPGFFPARHEPCSQSPSVTKAILYYTTVCMYCIAALLPFKFSKQYISHVSPNEYLLNYWQTYSNGDPALNLTSLRGTLTQWPTSSIHFCWRLIIYSTLTYPRVRFGVLKSGWGPGGVMFELVQGANREKSALDSKVWCRTLQVLRVVQLAVEFTTTVYTYEGRSMVCTYFSECTLCRRKYPGCAYWLRRLKSQWKWKRLKKTNKPKSLRTPQQWSQTHTKLCLLYRQRCTCIIAPLKQVRCPLGQ